MRAIVANLGWALMLPFALTVLFGLVVDHFIWRRDTPDFFLTVFGVTLGELVLRIILVVAAHLAWVMP